MVGLADVYGTMTTDRVYQKARSHEEVMELILSGKCGTFNPTLLKCLEAIADRTRSVCDKPQ